MYSKPSIPRLVNPDWFLGAAYIATLIQFPISRASQKAPFFVRLNPSRWQVRWQVELLLSSEWKASLREEGALVCPSSWR